MKRKPRSIVLEILRNIRRNSGVMTSAWAQNQTTYDLIVNGNGSKSTVWRKLRDDEKIENSAQEWARLMKFMDAVIDDAETVRDFARDRLAELSK